MKKSILWLLILVIITPVMTISNTHAETTEDLPLLKETDKTPILKKVLEHIRGTRHFKKARGTKDPHFPAKISITPKLIPLPKDHSLKGLDPAIQETQLSLDAITPELLKQLSQEDLEHLLTFLDEVKVKIRYNCSGKWHIHPLHAAFGKKTSGTVALALAMGAKQDEELFGNLMAFSSPASIALLKGRSASLFSADATAIILTHLVKHINKDSVIDELDECVLTAAYLVEMYIKYWAGKDVRELSKALTSLVARACHHINNLPNHFTPQQIGVLIGTTLAGTLAHSKQIKSTDEQRLWDVNTSTNLVWATSTFLGVVPWYSGNIAAAAIGTISVAAVVAQAGYNQMRRPRNYSYVVKRIKGRIEAAALSSCNTEDEESVRKTILMLAWLQTTVHLTGLAN